MGFPAQKVFPSWVKAAPDGYKTIDTSGLDALLVESTRTLKTENDKLEGENAKLHRELAAIEDRLAVLEGKRKPLSASLLGSDGIGLFGLGAAAAALVLTRRKRTKSDR